MARYTRTSPCSIPLKSRLPSAFRAHIQIRYGVDLAVAVEQPRQSDFGEMAVPAAFQLAKQLRQAPEEDRRRAGGRDRRPSPAWRPWKWRATATSTSGSTAAHMRARCWRGEAGEAAPARREDHRRAHQHQSQQGGAHRPPAQRHAGRHVRAHAARARPSRGGAELHRQHRRAGGRRGGGLPLPRKQSARRRPRAAGGPGGALRLLLLGSLRAHLQLLQGPPRSAGVAQADAARHRSGRGRTGGAGAPGGRRHRATRTWPPCCGWTWSTTCCRAKARSCI